MRAVVLNEFGPPEVLVPSEVPDPVAGPGQVVIEVELASVTFVETQVRGGRSPNPAMAPRLPVVPGNGVGGVVIAVGGGVDTGALGSTVVTTTGGSGGYAERVAVDAGGLIPVPDGVALADAVALLADGRTATALIRNAAIRPDETVLVEAAAGGVGSLLVQMAASAGARVVGAAGGERKLELVRTLGASVAVDYGEPGWPDGLPEVDVVFDGVGGSVARSAFQLLRAGGRFCAFGMASGSFADISDEEASRRGVTLVQGIRPTPAEMIELTKAALAEAAAGRLRPVIGQTFPLERAADAHAAIEGRGTVGKTLLVVSPSSLAGPMSLVSDLERPEWPLR
jgi:NADPH:quinone reductase